MYEYIKIELLFIAINAEYRIWYICGDDCEVGDIEFIEDVEERDTIDDIFLIKLDFDGEQSGIITLEGGVS